jgi:microcompartment protein CcmK/EutM
MVVILSAPAVAQTPQERIDKAMTRSQEVGIPISLLDSKVAEGKAKGVPLDRIATAVESRLRNLEQAKLVLSRAANDVDTAGLSVAADAIGAGVSEAVLEKIAASTGSDRRAIAIAVLTQLVLHGTAPDAALLQVRDAVARGPQALANLAAQSAAKDHSPETAKPRGAVGGNIESSTRDRVPPPASRPIGQSGSPSGIRGGRGR